MNEWMESSRKELHLETDYLREASIQTDYHKRLEPYSDDYNCPQIIHEMTTEHILCSEFVEGVEIDSLQKMP